MIVAEDEERTTLNWFVTEKSNKEPSMKMSSLPTVLFVCLFLGGT